MKLLPAIDIYKGKCVRLEKGEFQKSVIYNSCPFDQAKNLSLMVLTHCILLI